ncbi:retrovirus-related Pol polyprotein from transposon TNT 1-94 [Trichonephila clavipes]|nr:retrovirus-related Pol polyprotein from transposon TNT 1-94 [Trichonephila clavipes]
MIASTVSDAVYQKIMDKKTAFEAWESLRKQFEATSKDQLFKICHDDVVLYGSRNVNGSLFKANFEPILPKEMIEVLTVIADSSCQQLYHERWGHQDKRHIRNMLEKELGIHIKLDKELCEPCIYSQKHTDYHLAQEKASEPGELISADVCGPFDESFQKKSIWLYSKTALQVSLWLT